MLEPSISTMTSARKKKPPEVLARGVRRRGNSLMIVLTHPDGREERRSLGNVSAAFAATQRVIFQREITEGKYIKPVPRTERCSFKTIADAAVEHAKTYKRCWGSDEQRAAVFIDWWGNRFADEITPAEITAKLQENLAPKGA